MPDADHDDGDPLDVAEALARIVAISARANPDFNGPGAVADAWFGPYPR